MPAQARILGEGQAGVGQRELGPQPPVVRIADRSQQREGIGAAVEEEGHEHGLRRSCLGRLEHALFEQRELERAGVVDGQGHPGRPQDEGASVEARSSRNGHTRLDARET